MIKHCRSQPRWAVYIQRIRGCGEEGRKGVCMCWGKGEKGGCVCEWSEGVRGGCGVSGG